MIEILNRGKEAGLRMNGPQLRLCSGEQDCADAMGMRRVRGRKGRKKDEVEIG